MALLLCASSSAALQVLLGPAETGVTLGLPMTLSPPRTPFTRAERLERLDGLLRERILVLDGAMGTLLQRHQLSEEEFRGERDRKSVV